MDVEPAVLAEASADDADSLVSSNEPDDLENEQTWPTEEEMRAASSSSGADDAIPDAKKGTTPKRVKKVPKGTSEYQAAWIIDGDDEEEGEGENGEEREVQMEEEEEMVEMPVNDDEDMETDGRKSVAFEDLDMEEEKLQYVFPAFFLLTGTICHAHPTASFYCCPSRSSLSSVYRRMKAERLA